jgi:hypothetical protein
VYYITGFLRAARGVVRARTPIFSSS